MDQARTLAMQDRRVVEVGKDEEDHGNTLVDEICIYILLADVPG